MARQTFGPNIRLLTRFPAAAAAAALSSAVRAVQAAAAIFCMRARVFRVPDLPLSTAISRGGEEAPLGRGRGTGVPKELGKGRGGR